MTRVPFVAALFLVAAVASESRTVGPRRHGGGRPAAHVAMPRPATPAFTRPRVAHNVARPAAPHRGFVPARPAGDGGPAVRRTTTRPVLPTRPSTTGPSPEPADAHPPRRPGGFGPHRGPADRQPAADRRHDD